MSPLYETASRLLNGRDPPAGLRWEPDHEDRPVIYALLQKLANRRLIRHWHGGFHYVASLKSCEAIREYLTTALCELPSQAGVRVILELTRQRVQSFQSYLEQTYPKERYSYDNVDVEGIVSGELIEVLAELRDAFADVVHQLASAYSVALFDFHPSTGAFSVR